jgi:hypothetical protein
MVFSGGDDSNRDPTHWWAQSPARVRTMLQSSGFYDAVQLPRTEARFHAVHARRSKEADAFVAACDPQASQQACREVFGKDADVSQAAQCIETRSILQFAVVTQHVDEMKARRRHQVDR